MNGIMDENQLTVLKKYEVFKLPIHKIDSIIDNSYADCHNKCFRTFKYICIYCIKFTNIGNNEVINLTISDKNMGLYELNKKLKIASQRFYF